MNFLELPISLEQEIYRAFDGIQLGDGIGYFEADAIDGYLKKDSEEYKTWKEKDERQDWKKLVPLFEKIEGDMQVIFMDAKGLHYYLPIFLLAGTSLDYFSEKFLEAMESPSLPEEANEWDQWNRQKYFTLKELLTPEQKQCILNCLEYLADYPNWIKYFQFEEDLSRKEAMAKAQDWHECRTWIQMKKHLGPPSTTPP